MNKFYFLLVLIYILIQSLIRGSSEHSRQNVIGPSQFQNQQFMNDATIFKEDDQIDGNINGKRKLAPAQMRINFDIGYLKSYSSFSTSLISQLTNLFMAASDFYYNLIKLNEPIVGSINIPSTTTTCNTYTFSDAQKKENYLNTDLLFFVDYTLDSSLSGSFKTKNNICETDSTNKRVIIAQISFTFKSVSTVFSDYQFNLLLKQVIHEIMHVLALNTQLINYFRDSSGNLYDSSIKDLSNQKISYPNTLQWAKDYYGCTTLTSIPVEIAASGDIHWNRVILLDDLMSGLYTYGEGLWSGINNAILKDSGWYTVDSTIADTQIKWGKNKLCQFIDQGCAGQGFFEEFCITNKNLGLTLSQNAMGYCSPFYTTKSDQYSKAPTNYLACQFMVPVQNRVCSDPDNQNLALNKELVTNYNYVFGYSSRAFQSSLTPLMQQESSSYACYTSKCSTDNASVEITFGSYTFYCVTGGQDINSANPFEFQGILGCPEIISDFCNAPTPCQNFCSSSGYCLNNQCTCIYGYSGKGCECATGFEYGNGSCRTCSSTCLTCSDTIATQCASCNDGYYLSNGSCLACGASCKTCSSTTPTECTSCKSGFFLDSSTKTCSLCSDNCTSCTSLINCTACSEGYGFNSTNYCSIACIYGCKKCYGNPLNCSECYSEKVLNTQTLVCECPKSKYQDQNGDCQNCKLNCSSCTTIKDCTECEDGYELKTLSKTCVEIDNAALLEWTYLSLILFIFLIC